MEEVALFLSGRGGFFREPACVSCSVDEYCACEGADLLFDVDRVLRRKLINIGEGIMISEPLKVEKGLVSGSLVFASLSHQGVLAIHACNGGHPLQFTDLGTGRQVGMDVEGGTLVGFYDDRALLLTWGQLLREARLGGYSTSQTLLCSRG